jgi:hypothetical protein
MESGKAEAEVFFAVYQQIPKEEKLKKELIQIQGG